MIELNELIAFWNGRLQEHPPMSSLDWHDVCLSTLTYLNAYGTTNAMLRDLGGNGAALEAEGKAG